MIDNGSLATVLGTGQVTITTRVGKKLQSLVLRDVLYVPALRRNLLSVSSLRDHHKVLFNRDQVLITQYGGRCVAVASHKDNLYMLKQLHVATAEVNLVDQRSSNLLMVWHRRLGHVVFRSLQCLTSLGRLGSLTKALAQDFKLCVGCLGGTYFRKGIPRRFKNTVSSTKPLELVHSDVCGPIKASRGGFVTLSLSRMIVPSSLWFFSWLRKVKSFKSSRSFRLLQLSFMVPTYSNSDLDTRMLCNLFA